MHDDLVQRIASHPRYRELKARRSSFGWWLTLSMMVVHHGFILLADKGIHTLGQARAAARASQLARVGH